MVMTCFVQSYERIGKLVVSGSVNPLDPTA